MTLGKRTVPSRRIVTWVLTLCVAAARTTARQAPGADATRHLWDTSFIDQGNKPAASRRSTGRRYRVVTPRVPTAGVVADSVIGVTLWRLRPSRPADSGE